MLSLKRGWDYSNEQKMMIIVTVPFLSLECNLLVPASKTVAWEPNTHKYAIQWKTNKDENTIQTCFSKQFLYEKEQQLNQMCNNKAEINNARTSVNQITNTIFLWYLGHFQRFVTKEKLEFVQKVTHPFRAIWILTNYELWIFISTNPIFFDFVHLW